MAVWMELRCENRTAAMTGKVDTLDTISARCWSHNNAGPMEMAADDQRSVAAVARDLFAQAKSGGWKRTRDGWICPHCATPH